jgi:hypothetical protein
MFNICKNSKDKNCRNPYAEPFVVMLEEEKIKEKIRTTTNNEEIGNSLVKQKKKLNLNIHLMTTKNLTKMII